MQLREPRSLGDLVRDAVGPLRLTERERLTHGVHRLYLGANGTRTSVVVKRLARDAARRNELLAFRWLPAAGLGDLGPPLLASGEDRNGGSWHVYEDLGANELDPRRLDRERVAAAVAAIARLHVAFAGHPLLAECRAATWELGPAFYLDSVRRALARLDALRPPPERAGVVERLRARLTTLADEAPRRERLVADAGGPDTLLHGDLWPKNVLVPPGGPARLIDWDRVGVGPASYDLSIFLLRCPRDERTEILDLYARAVTPVWRVPPRAELNAVFETQECARLANWLIWRAEEAERFGEARSYDDLEHADEWFGELAATPVLPG